MATYVTSRLYADALAARPPGTDVDHAARDRLRVAYGRMRDRAALIAAEINRYLRASRFTTSLISMRSGTSRLSSAARLCS